MFSLKERIKILTKIAQQAATPSSGTATSAPATTTQSVAPAPQFNPVTGPWAWLPSVYNTETVRYLSYMLNIISTAMHYTTNGQYNLQKNQNDVNSIDPSGLPSVDAKNIVMLAKLFYSTFLNNGNQPPQKPQAIQINQWARNISGSQPLLNLSQLTQTGTLAQQLNAQFRLDGSFRQNIINYLNYIIQYNPVQQ